MEKELDFNTFTQRKIWKELVQNVKIIATRYVFLFVH